MDAFKEDLEEEDKVEVDVAEDQNKDAKSMHIMSVINDP